MITYTNTERPVHKYSAREIFCMTPQDLKKQLQHLIVKEPDMAGKIEACLGYEFDWTESTYAYFLISICWAKLEDPEETASLLNDMKIDQRIQGILKD